MNVLCQFIPSPNQSRLSYILLLFLAFTDLEWQGLQLCHASNVFLFEQFDCWLIDMRKLKERAFMHPQSLCEELRDFNNGESGSEELTMNADLKAKTGKTQKKQTRRGLSCTQRELAWEADRDQARTGREGGTDYGCRSEEKKKKEEKEERRSECQRAGRDKREHRER